MPRIGVIDRAILTYECQNNDDLYRNTVFVYDSSSLTNVIQIKSDLVDTKTYKYI